MALDTLKTILPRWVSWKTGAVELFAESAYPLPAGTPKFLGTLIQRFNIRRGRAAAPYRNNIADIKERTRGNFFEALSTAGMTLDNRNYGQDLVDDGFCLSEIADFQGLLPKSYDAGVPVFELTDAEIRETGPIFAGMQEKREMFKGSFGILASKIGTMMDHA
jgi:hypothetical protein